MMKLVTIPKKKKKKKKTARPEIQGLRGQVGDWGRQQRQLARRLMRGGRRRPVLSCYRGILSPYKQWRSWSG